MDKIRYISLIFIMFFGLSLAYGIGIKSIDLILDSGKFLLGSMLAFTFSTYARL